MADSTSSVTRPGPWQWPAALAACAVGTYLSPGLSAILIYDRSAILGGELWRLITGNWVHFSASHLSYDVIVLGVAGWLIESRGYRFFPALCGVTALAIGLAIFAALPDMAQYGGLSGVAMASAVYLALHGLREASPWRWIGVGILAFCLAKLLSDVVGGGLALIEWQDEAVVNVPLSHVVGAAAGLGMYLWSRRASESVTGAAPAARAARSRRAASRSSSMA